MDNQISLRVYRYFCPYEFHFKSIDDAIGQAWADLDNGMAFPVEIPVDGSVYLTGDELMAAIHRWGKVNIGSEE